VVAQLWEETGVRMPLEIVGPDTTARALATELADRVGQVSDG
jgi:hypothetical protein